MVKKIRGYKYLWVGIIEDANYFGQVFWGILGQGLYIFDLIVLGARGYRELYGIWAI